jgi:hypothetical protein
MFDSITFCVGRKTISLYGQELLLGELSEQVVNIGYQQIQEMYDILKGGKSLAEKYAGTRDDTLLNRAYDCYQKLEDILRQYPLLALLLDEECLFPKEFDPKAPRHLCILACLEHAREVLDSILIFRKAIDHFIRTFITPMRELTAGNISNAAAVLNSEFYRMYLPERDDLGFCPYRDGMVELKFETVASNSGTNKFQVLEKYATESLLMLLTVDFYKALGAGHLIRQCEYCGRFFLLTKRLHTKYCDNPAPDNPKYTCAQMGYQKSRKKEQPEDDPKADSLRRCLNRITQDCSRKRITPEERDRLKAKVDELFHEAKIRSGVTYEEFEKSLASENLYPLCNVIKKINPVGRPKAEKAG